MNIEVILRILELCDTLNEAVLYVERKIDQLKFEIAYEMLNNVLVGLLEVGYALAYIREELILNDLDFLLEDLIESLEKFMEAYEQGNISLIMQIMSEMFVPAYQSWQSELQRCLKPMIIS